ncbi:MAG: hypothetical protein IPQ07_38080 [Myxococcales bacterium]|nr:hypothetical protein [Myxococcales bacterium]
MLDADGERAQKLWRCPRTCKPTDDPPAALAPLCAKAIDNAHRLVGVDVDAGDEPEFTTCPSYYARLPEAFELSGLLGWYKKGQLHLRAPNPSRALVDAIDCVESALAQREADELRRIRARAESEPQRGDRG